MRLLSALLLAPLVLGGCGLTQDRGARSPTSVVQVLTTPTSEGRPAQTARPTATVVPSSAAYDAFLSRVCQAFTARDAGTLRAALPYYRYNTGLRYGRLGGGEGQNGDPGLFSTWLTGATVRCASYSPDVAGHGTLLTTGWKRYGGAALIDLDTFNGAWKFNDFTFGREAALRFVMKGAMPIIPYQG